ncbi:MAG: DUF4340 domain-containing protein [Desulfobaccales bacterium]
MNPRRLIPYAVVFLALVATYAGLRWYQVYRQAREIQAEEVFAVKTGEISAMTLKRPGGEIQLARQGKDWEINQPLKAKADAATVEEMLGALAGLKMVRNLGPGDLKVFGLDQPALQVSFIAKGEQHRLALGGAVPGDQGYYARKDDGPGVFIVATGVRDFLNQQLFALRDKTLWAFNADQVKSLKIRSDQNQVDLEKGSANTWSWVGRPEMRVSPPRLAQLLQDLSGVRVTEFPAAPPPDLQAAGLAPQARMEVTVSSPQGVESLYLGAQTPNGVYARLGAQGQVVLVARNLPEKIQGVLANLEDRRLWIGLIPEVSQVAWGPPGLPSGPPGQTWSARREGDIWKITGPNRAAVQQPAYRMEMALFNLQKLEFSRLVNLPQAGTPATPVFMVELFDQAGKPLFRLEQLANLAKGQAETEVRATSGGNTVTAVVPQEALSRWQEEMARLAAPPPAPK